MTKEPAYILRARIRRYESLLANPKTLPLTRRVAAELLAETRRELEALVVAEVAHEAQRMLH
jgi:hypothetical protein